MQVARILEPPKSRGIFTKLFQMLRALQLEERYSKDEILSLYLTLAPFGGNLEGVRPRRCPISARTRRGSICPRRRCWSRCRNRR